MYEYIFSLYILLSWVNVFHSFARVKKPDEFNRPRIPVSERKVRRSKAFASKKVHIVISHNVYFN